MEFFALVKNDFRTRNFIDQCCKTSQFLNPEVHELDEWILYYNPKYIKTCQTIADEDSTLVVAGTIIYKDCNQRDSLVKVKQELDNGSANTENWFGSFGIVYFCKGKVRIIVDQFAMQSIYSDTGNSFFSTSLLISKLLVGDENLSINKLALTESITTGSLVGPDTLFNEINRFEPHLNWSEYSNVKVEVACQMLLDPGMKPTSYSEAINLQIECIEETFQAVSTFANETGIDSGITSGLDSRLLLAFMKENWDNFQLHTHFRNYDSSEVKIAQKVADAAEVQLIIEKVHATNEKTDDELSSTMSDAYNFTDGIIRMHGFWVEDYNTADHRISVIGDKKTGISGIGGEQYRNMDQLFRTRIKLKKFVKYHWIYAISGKAISSKKDEDILIDRISSKIACKLDIKDDDYLSLFEIKRIWNEVFIPARLGGRNNAENQISHFISPFAFAQLSTTAYHAIPHLGHAYQFQIDILKKVSPKLAKLPSDYGFDFMGKQPKTLFLKAVYHSYIHPAIKNALREKKILRNGNPYFGELMSQYSDLARQYDQLRKIDLPIKYDVLEVRRDVTPLLMNAGYLLEKANLGQLRD